MSLNFLKRLPSGEYVSVTGQQDPAFGIKALAGYPGPKSSKENKSKLKMSRRDFFGIYAPVAYIFSGVAAMIVCACTSEPLPANISGPSGSDMVCVFYFGLHLFLWLPIGILLVVLHVLRYRTSHAGPFYDSQRHVIGIIIGLVFSDVAYLLLKGEDGYLIILGISLLVNLLPCVVFYAVGRVLTRHRREQTVAEQDAEDRRPSL
ncbi:MAG: hypothetical protein ACJA16_005414 [Akkermansiaceae bacterium]|jgi:hypothetical protein